MEDEIVTQKLEGCQVKPSQKAGARSIEFRSAQI